LIDRFRDQGSTLLISAVREQVRNEIIPCAMFDVEEVGLSL
jgi:hypothetical protein